MATPSSCALHAAPATFIHCIPASFLHPCAAADSNAPTWKNNLDGQVNLRDAIRGTITFTAPNGKYYKLKESGLATLLVR